jgi:hypothetical protein
LAIELRRIVDVGCDSLVTFGFLLENLGSR